jgi:hypothetical protein
MTVIPGSARVLSSGSKRDIGQLHIIENHAVIGNLLKALSSLGVANPIRFRMF